MLTSLTLGVASSWLAATGALLPPTPTPLMPSDETDVRVEAGAGKGVIVTVGDDAFRFGIRGRGQVRFDVDAADGAAEAAFVVRRLRLTMSGDALHKRFGWNVQLAFAPRDLEKENPSVLRDAWLVWNIAKPVRLRVGQMKVPFDRQRVTSSASLQFAERSDVVNELTLDRDLGAVAFAKLFDHVDYEVGVFSGDGRNRLNTDLGLLFVGRLRVSPLGAFDDDQSEGDLERGPARLSFGGAVAYNVGTPRDKSTVGAIFDDGSIDYLHGTVDVLFKARGFSVLTAGLLRASMATTGPVTTARSAAGVFAQAGVMFGDGLEVTARVGHIEPIVDVGAIVANDDGLVRSEEVRAGFNVYVLGHDIKLSSDIGLTVTDVVAVNGHLMGQIAF